MNKVKMLMITLFSLVLVGCIPNPDLDSEEITNNGGTYEVKENSDEVESKILTSHVLKAESDSLEDDLNGIINYVHNQGGYISSNIIDKDETDFKSNRSSKTILRVPSEHLNHTINKIKETVLINSESQTSVDVTNEYSNIDLEIETLLLRKERLNELYLNSKDIKEIIEIENEISNLEKKIKEEKQRRDKIDELMKFSRIDLEVKEVDKIKYNNLTNKEKIKNEISEMKNVFYKVFTIFIVYLIKLIPFAILFGILQSVYNKYIKKTIKRKLKDNSINENNSIKKEQNYDEKRKR